MSEVHLVRGLPGSGKSTFAKSLGILHLESDLLTIQFGEYAFDPRKLGERHDACFAMFCTALAIGCDVVVSNTFTTVAEIEPYIERARSLGHSVNVHWMQGRFESVHDVPDVTIQKMRTRWESVHNEIHHTFRSES